MWQIWAKAAPLLSATAITQARKFALNTALGEINCGAAANSLPSA
jgi:hypothetical protein